MLRLFDVARTERTLPSFNAAIAAWTCCSLLSISACSSRIEYKSDSEDAFGGFVVLYRQYAGKFGRILGGGWPGETCII